MEHRTLGSTHSIERGHHFGVCVAVVDLQRQAMFLGDGDVLLKGVRLGRLPLRTGAEEVQAGFADGSHARLARQLGNAGQMRFKHTLLGKLGRLIRVQCDRGKHPRISRRQLGRPARRGEVGTDLHDACHTNRRCPLEVFFGRQRQRRIGDL